jgi:membrane protein implicated in regulation of membrane protease activity
MFVQGAAFILGIVLFGLAIVIGGFLLAGLLGLGLIAWLVISARIWWLTRNAARRRDTDERIVDAEYHVVEVSDRDERTDT